MASVDLLLLQEVEVMYIIPTIRRYLALYLKELGRSQKTIAEILALRESTVSQYMSNKRGCKIELSQETLAAIKTAASHIQKKFDTIREIQRILKHIRNSEEICKIHKQVADMPEQCNPIELGCIHHDNYPATLHKVRV
ncbi:transcriptional regulator [Candidatus Woesearchaeota archaeon]|nr:transcriptional regulator [Candidatus Woesearchaeota archaeon]